MSLGLALVVSVAMVLFCVYGTFRKLVAVAAILGIVGGGIFLGIEAWKSSRQSAQTRPGFTRTGGGTVYRVAECAAPIQLEIEHDSKIYRFSADHFLEQAEIDKVAAEFVKRLRSGDGK